jgi:nucleoside-diphosphate-sugar epimerase
MRIFVAGATGAVGKRLVPMLVDKGHEVTGMTRSRPEQVRALGATPVTADALDRRAVEHAVAEAKPDVVVHQLTALGDSLDMRHFDRDFAQTNRLRTTGTDNLLAAARAAGATKFVAQSYAGWPFARDGNAVKSEDEPLDPHPAKAMRQSHDAIEYLERTVAEADGVEGIVLRYGGFYGPGTSLSSDGGEQVELIRKRRFPVVGDGAGVWSFTHIDDAAASTLAAIEHGTAGIYNVTDDEPARVADWLPQLAKALDAPPPRHVPRWLGRMLAGEVAVVMMTEVRGASNAKAKRELGWTPAWPSWREGFVSGL